MDSSEQIVAHITSDTDHSGFRPNVVTNTKDDYVCARIAGRPWTVTESCCFARKASTSERRVLFKVEWCGDGFVGLCSKTYYCFGATDKYSTKGLSKRHNDIDKDTFLAVLKNRRSGGGFNRGFRVRDSSVMTYIQERAALTYFYGKRKVLATVSVRRLWKCKRKRQPDDRSFTHMDPRWKHPFTCIVAGPTDVVRQRLSLDCYEILPQ